jgi:hypothetical protein
MISDTPIFVGESARRLVSVRIRDDLRFVVFCGSDPTASHILSWVRTNFSPVQIPPPTIENAIPKDVNAWVIVDSVAAKAHCWAADAQSRLQLNKFYHSTQGITNCTMKFEGLTACHRTMNGRDVYLIAQPAIKFSQVRDICDRLQGYLE